MKDGLEKKLNDHMEVWDVTSRVKPRGDSGATPDNTGNRELKRAENPHIKSRK